MNTKLIVAVVIVGVLAVTVVGLVAAQIATANPNGTTANGATNGGFFGWMGRCLGFRGASYYGYYTMQVLKGGNPVGMMAVYGSTGQVMYYSWMGTFMQQKVIG